MSRIRDFFKKIKKLDNRGEAMILMIVAIGIIMFLGMSILYATGTAFMIRNTERRSEDTFDSADTGMDLLKNRLTEVESKAAEQGYSKVLNLYASSKADQVNFQNSFIDGLVHTYISDTGEITVTDTYSSGEALFPGGSTSAITSYSEAAIQKLFKGKESEGDKYSLKCSGTAKLSDDLKSVTLKGITLTYTRHDGYVTSVTTDIKLKVPNITASSPTRGFEKNVLNDFSCVADQGLIFYDTQSGGSTANAGDFEGSIYAGSVNTKTKNLDVAEGKKIIIGRTRVTSEDAAGNVTYSTDRTDGQLNVDLSNDSTENGGGIVIHKNAELWTQDINLDHNASLSTEMNSNVYVADDLNFRNGGSATIKGNYFGFGNGSRASESSSIIFNSTKKGLLDTKDAQSIMLAGRSFIMQNEKADNGNEIGMGSSVTAKSEQRAYLIPAGDGTILGSTISNPQRVSTADEETVKGEVKALVTANKDKSVFNMKEPLSKYWTNGQPQVEVLSYPVSGVESYMQYYFFKFDSTAEANAYFKDYFDANSDQINSYVKQYADVTNLKSTILRTSGTGLTNKNGSLETTDALSDSDDITEMNNQALKYQTQYKNLSETLDENSSGSTTPFYSMIDIDSLHETCRTRDKKNLVPVAWWTDQNNIEAVDSEDDVNDPHGGNKLVVVNTLYYDKQHRDSSGRYNYVMYIYENGVLYKLTLERAGDSVKTTPNPGDTIVVQDGRNFVTKTYTGSTSSSDLANVVGIVSSGGKEANPSFSKSAGYVIWGDFDEKNFSNIAWGDNQLNFIVVDGNARIEHDFHGLIMCSGKLETAGGKVYLEDNIGSKILSRTHIWSANNSGSKSSSSEDWTLGKMVVYENWKKN